MNDAGKPKLLFVEPTRLFHDGRPARIKREGMRTLTLPYLAGLAGDGWASRIQIDSLNPATGDEPADLVCISVLTQRSPRAYQIADAFRARGVPVVLGGVHVTLNADEAAVHADALVIGEAEDVFGQVLLDAAAGRLQPVYRCEQLHSLKDLASPRFDLITNNRYFTLLRPVQTTRGCPHRCDFCTVRSVYGASYRHRPVEQVVQDIRRIRSTSRYVFFVDDNLAADVGYTTELFEALIPLRISWSAQMNLGFAQNQPLLKLAARSGFQMAVCGIENVNPENLASVGKQSVNRPERYHEWIRRFRKAGVIILAGMILGFDTDNADSIAANLHFMRTEKIPMISLYLLTPFPGTPLFARLEEQERLLTKNWSLYDSYTCVFRPKNLSPETLTDLYWQAARKITTVPAILRRFTPPPFPRLRSFFPDLIATSLVFTNNLVLFRKDAKARRPPQV